METDKIGHVPADEVVVPKLIEDTAKEIARAFFQNSHLQEERGVRSKIFRKEYPNEAWYVRTCWPHWIRDARHILTEMLNGSYPQDQKDDIYDALTAGFDQRTQYYPPPSVLYNSPGGFKIRN